MQSTPEIKTNLRSLLLKLPENIKTASGINIFGKVIKSLIFSTDVSIIRNSNADAIIAVYPFTPQPVITQAIMMVADIPVFCGVGGGRTTGKRVVSLASHAEYQGAIGVVVNAPTANDTLSYLREAIDIPIVLTIVSDKADIAERLRMGATILNVSGGAKTVDIVKKIRDGSPDVPIIATGGPTDETVQQTIEAGANAITWTPPTSGEVFKDIMEKYRMMESQDGV